MIIPLGRPPQLIAHHPKAPSILPNLLSDYLLIDRFRRSQPTIKADQSCHRHDQNRHDQFAKQYLKGMLSPFSQAIEISFELPPGEPQQIDVWFIPQSRQPIDLLG